MNRRMVLYITGQILKFGGLLFVLPLIVGLIYGEKSVIWIAVSGVITVLIGFLLSGLKPRHSRIYASEGFAVTALAWIMFSLCGALPFFLSGEIPNFMDAVFETVSGFTTTGASILNNIEALPNCLLFWRSFTHWVGGMGVLVFVLMVIPLAGERSMHIMRAEVPGPVVGKLVPRMKDTAKILYSIYLGMTVLQIILLMLGGMNLFDSMIHTFSTAGTGGFSNKNISVAAFDSAYIQTVIAVFMALFGINFSVFYLALIGNIRAALKSEELRFYLLIMFSSVVLVTMNILPQVGQFGKALLQGGFQVSSVMTTTGFVTTDFGSWPTFSKMILVMLMFFGASAGSTGGGVKIARLIILFKKYVAEFRKLLHPQTVTSIRLDGKTLPEETVKGVGAYFAAYAGVFLISMLIISLDKYNFETVFTTTASCLNNVGPALGQLGPFGNCSEFSLISKLVLSFDMLFGRLEIFPMLIAMNPAIWRRAS